MKKDPLKLALSVLIFIFICISLYLAVIAFLKSNNSKIENYVWDDKSTQSLYALGDWQTINSTVDQGLRQKGNYTSDLTLPYKYWVAGPNGERIDNAEMFALIFAPIETPGLAVSLAAVLSEDLVIIADAPQGQVKVIEGGFLVQLKQSNLFNCKPDVPNGVIYRVNTDGTVIKLAVENTSAMFIWEMFTAGVCVD